MARTDLYRKIQVWLCRSQLSEAASQRQQEALAKVSRRRLLGDTAHLLAWSSLPACVTQMAPAPMASAPIAPAAETEEDLLIVGGGLAGLSTAYELAKAGVRVSVYEGAERFGGRMFTAFGFNSENMFCEKGAEFVDTGHEDLIALAGELGVELQALHSPSSQLPHEVYFFGGRLRTEKEVIRAFKPLGKILLRDMQKLMVKGELQVPTYKQPLGDAVKALDKLSLAAYLDKCRASVDGWIVDLVQTAYVGEYGLEAGEQSALNLLLLIDGSTQDGFKIFGESDEAFRIKGGSSRLIEALVKKLEEMKVPLLTQHRLLAMQKRAQGHKLVFDVAGKTLDVNSKNVILALPLPILSKIEGLSSLDLSPRKKQLIKELGVGTNSKLMLGFKTRYWKEKKPGFAAHEGGIYTQGPSQAYWDSSRQQRGRAGIMTNFLGGEAGLRIGPGKVSQAMADLEQVMPGISAEHDGTKLLQHWSSNAWAGGSYLCPKPTQYTTLIGAAEESELGGTLHFVGEYCSVDYGGYMNGAIGSAKALVAALKPVSQDIKAS